MGLFDVLDDVLDVVVETPGKIVEKTVETVVRLPEVGIKTIDGAVKGVKKGTNKVDKALDDLMR